MQERGDPLLAEEIRGNGNRLQFGRHWFFPWDNFLRGGMWEIEIGVLEGDNVTPNA